LKECALPNGNRKRQPEGAIETATRNGNEKRQKDGSEAQGAGSKQSEG